MLEIKKILVTGVAGFIGSRIARRLLELGHHVIGIDDLSSGNAKNIPLGVEFILGDLSKMDLKHELNSRIDIVLHLAGQSSGEISFDDPVADLQKNTISTLNLLNFAKSSGVKKFLYASSMSVYGLVPENIGVKENFYCRPLSCYGVSKLASEHYLRIFAPEMNCIAMRMFNVYGPGQDLKNLRQGMVSIYLAQAISQKKIIVKGALTRFRDFIYIDDVVEAWITIALMKNIPSISLNIGSGIKTSVKQLLNEVCLITNCHNIELESSTPGDQNGIYADTSKFNAILKNFNFVKLNIGIKKFYEWAISQ